MEDKSPLCLCGKRDWVPNQIILTQIFRKQIFICRGCSRRAELITDWQDSLQIFCLTKEVPTAFPSDALIWISSVLPKFWPEPKEQAGQADFVGPINYRPTDVPQSISLHLRYKLRGGGFCRWINI